MIEESKPSYLSGWSYRPASASSSARPSATAAIASVSNKTMKIYSSNFKKINPYDTTNLRSALDQQCRVINDIHKRVIAVTKGLQKPAL